MSILGISTALADTANHAAAQQSSGSGFLSMPLMLIIFIAIFYFLLFRPQSKRAKEQKAMLDSVGLGDEVVTSGGVVGKVTKLRDAFIVLEIAKDVEATFQKSAIAAVLPKGSLNQNGDASEAANKDQN